MPLSLRKSPPVTGACVIRTDRWFVSPRSMRPPIRPSSNQMGSPARTSSKTCGREHPMEAGVRTCPDRSDAGRSSRYESLRQSERVSLSQANRWFERWKITYRRFALAAAIALPFPTQFHSRHEIGGLHRLRPTTGTSCVSDPQAPPRVARILKRHVVSNLQALQPGPRDGKASVGDRGRRLRGVTIGEPHSRWRCHATEEIPLRADFRHGWARLDGPGPQFRGRPDPSRSDS